MSIRRVPFAIVPVEAALDHRLTAMQYRVLIAILSFRSRNSDTVYPKRAAIASRSGYSLNSVSRVTAQLVKLGWLEKTGKGGFSSPSTYRITVPETLSDPETVAAPETVAGSDSTTFAGSDGKTMAGSDRRKEETIEQTIEQKEHYAHSVERAPNAAPSLIDQIREIYPKRDGGQRWADAERAIKARVKEGHQPDELIAGVRRYTEFIQAKGNEGTEFVQQAATFFGSNKGFCDPWECSPKADRDRGSSVSRMQQRIRERVMQSAGETGATRFDWLEGEYEAMPPQGKIYEDKS